jgi:hypothetical protein
MVDGPLKAKNLVTTQSRSVMFVEYDNICDEHLWLSG